MLDVYVGNLPGRVGAEDLRDLFNGVTGQTAFGLRKGKLISSLLAPLRAHASWINNILSSLRKASQETELNFTIVEDGRGQFGRYCRISGYSRLSAARLITQLAGAGLQGQVLEVRPFLPRNLTNDRRRAGWRFHRWLGIECRKGERRCEKQSILK